MYVFAVCWCVCVCVCVRAQARTSFFLKGGSHLEVERYICARSAKSLAAGVQGPLKAPGSSGVLDALWCNLCLISEHFAPTFLTNTSVA